MSCPVSRLYIQYLGAVNVPSPTVTDNSGAVASFNVSYNLDHPVTKDINITWTATDHAGNEAVPCTLKVLVIGM